MKLAIHELRSNVINLIYLNQNLVVRDLHVLQDILGEYIFKVTFQIRENVNSTKISQKPLIF